MTPGDLYERAVALGLCERAKWHDQPIKRIAGRWCSWYDESPTTIPNEWTGQVEDLCTMTVLRALLKIKDGPFQLVGNESEPYYFACFLEFDMPYDAPGTLHDAQSESLLSSLCLCLLRARGHVESEKE